MSYMSSETACIFLALVEIVVLPAAGNARVRCSPGYFLNSANRQCQRCPSGMYSPVPMTLTACIRHTDCSALYRRVLIEGTSMTDNHCGQCLIHYVDEESRDQTDPSSFPSVCVLCNNAQPEVSALNPRQCPSPHKTSHEDDEQSAVYVTTTIIGASLVAVCVVTLALAVLAKECLSRRTKKPVGILTPKTVDLLTQKQLETHGCALNTVVTDALVQKHQGISIHSAD